MGRLVINDDLCKIICTIYKTVELIRETGMRQT